MGIEVNFLEGISPFFTAESEYSWYGWLKGIGRPHHCEVLILPRLITSPADLLEESHLSDEIKCELRGVSDKAQSLFVLLLWYPVGKRGKLLGE